MANGAWGQLGLEEVVVRVGLDVWHSNAVYHTMDLGTVANNPLSVRPLPSTSLSLIHI